MQIIHHAQTFKWHHEIAILTFTIAYVRRKPFWEYFLVNLHSPKRRRNNFYHPTELIINRKHAKKKESRNNQVTFEIL